MLSTDEAVDAFKGPGLQADIAIEGGSDLDQPTERKQTTAMVKITALSAFERRLLGWDLL